MKLIIDVDEFLEELDDILDAVKKSKSVFRSNMIHLNAENRSFCDWLETILAWNELGSDKDYYWFYCGKNIEEEEEVLV